MRGEVVLTLEDRHRAIVRIDEDDFAVLQLVPSTPVSQAEVIGGMLRTHGIVRLSNWTRRVHFYAIVMASGCSFQTAFRIAFDDELLLC
ncbi:MAG TPA: hypothetical protein PJ986_09215 [Gammaproteobacteria bacterium]|mgnify:CR=1 FL=1|nr:hypothetical protein [Gammaproteobacteria bacterium]